MLAKQSFQFSLATKGVCLLCLLTEVLRIEPMAWKLQGFTKPPSCPHLTQTRNPSKVPHNMPGTQVCNGVRYPLRVKMDQVNVTRISSILVKELHIN